MKYTFTCTAFPQLKILVKRGKNLGEDIWAQFNGAGFETEDPEIAEIVRKTQFVHEDKEIKAADLRFLNAKDPEHEIKIDLSPKEQAVAPKKRGRKPKASNEQPSPVTE